MGVMRPDLVMRSIIPVIMAGILGIYGLIISIVINGSSKRLTQTCPIIRFIMAGILGIYGLIISIVINGTRVRANAQQPKLFVGMMLILIFAEALGLYGARQRGPSEPSGRVPEAPLREESCMLRQRLVEQRVAALEEKTRSADKSVQDTADQQQRMFAAFEERVHAVTEQLSETRCGTRACVIQKGNRSENNRVEERANTTILKRT
ncbi:UNVERIFIED_CONTAM: hypothetical protein H355_003854 [Colinus virginianus]|nr:hypothetical protein H355_003854 [Colinus virginianus]